MIVGWGHDCPPEEARTVEMGGSADTGEVTGTQVLGQCVQQYHRGGKNGMNVNQVCDALLSPGPGTVYRLHGSGRSEPPS